ncbi:hypothetical protein QYF61_009975 [Mycteria americana]|uniref:Uncharacterized protein n=1 Tax=Mycteria americana TaxID=33587 RepID=A0AAN7RRG4_MYCAM|nr:hypothetical protein QYF61_009975 [Mycteria americana]
MVPHFVGFEDQFSQISEYSPHAKPVPMLDNPFGEENFPNIQSKPPLVQLEAISSCPMAYYLGQETDPHLSTTSFQVAVESDKVSPQPPFLQAKQPQFPQPLLIRHPLLEETVLRQHKDKVVLNKAQEVQTDAKPTGQFKIAPISCDAGVNKICQKYKRRRFQTAPENQQLRFTQTKLGTAASHAICIGMVHGQQLCPCSAEKPLLTAPVPAHSLGQLLASWHCAGS